MNEILTSAGTLRPSSDRRSVTWIVCLGLVAYATALLGTFVYDDLHSVRENASIRSLSAIPSFFWDVDAFSSLAARMYRPVVLTTLAIDHFVGGGAAWVFKLSNVLLHAANAALMFWLLRALGVARKPVFVACCLVAVHPLASEAVNMVSSRSDLLCTLGLLLAMRSYLWVQSGDRRAMLWVFLGTAIACGSKATGVIVPAMCCVLELLRWVRRRDDGGADPAVDPSWLRVGLRLAPVVGMVGVYLLVRRACLGVATLELPQLTDGDDVFNGSGRDLVTQFSLMGYVLPRFVAQAVLPVGLTIDPWIPLHDDWSSASVLCGWVFVLSLTFLGLRAPRRRSVLFFATCFAWCSAAPWILIPLNLPACEHRFYASLVGLGCALAAVLPTRWFEGGVGRLRASVPTMGLVVSVALFAFGSAVRSLDYRDADVLWTGALRGYPESIRALHGSAMERRADAYAAHLRGDRDGEALQLHHACALVERAIAIYPEYVLARRCLAEFELALGPGVGDGDRALEMADWLVRRKATNPFLRLLRSRVLMFAERYDEAVEAALGVLDIAEPKGLVFRTAATARALQGDLPAAIELLDRSVAMGLDHESVLLQRADYLLRRYRVVAAERDVRTVLSRDPFHGEALRLLERIRAGGSATPIR